MRHCTAALAALMIGGPLFAGGELGILLDRQSGKAQSVGASQQVAAGDYSAVNPTGMGFRVGASVLDIGIMSINFSATYHPKAEEDLKLNGSSLGKLGNSYVAVGTGLDWKLLLNLHAGVELRRETLSADLAAPPPGSARYTGSTSQTRPWLKFGAGFSVPLVVVSPFARLELAVPTTKATKTGTPDDLRQALAPQFQVAVYGGIRF